MWLGSPQQISQVAISHVPVLSELIKVVESARDLGVVIDTHLSLSAYVATLCRSGLYHLRQLRPIARSLSTEAATTLVHAFISSRLDYCNSLVFSVPDVLLRKVQSVQNAAARLVTGAKKRDHITPVLQQLHWLPVRRRIEFKIACLVHQSCVTPPKGGSKSEFVVFVNKIHVHSNKVCYEVHLCENFQRQSCDRTIPLSNGV